MADFIKQLFGGAEARPEFQQFAGAFGTGALREPGRRFGGQLEGILGQGPSDIFGTLQQELLQPSFAPSTASEESLISSIMDLAGGRSAGRGLGPASAGGIGQAIAPTLTSLRNQRVSNLMQGLQAEQGFRGQDIGALLNLIQLAAPQIMGGQVSEQFTGIVPAISGFRASGG